MYAGARWRTAVIVELSAHDCPVAVDGDRVAKLGRRPRIVRNQLGGVLDRLVSRSRGYRRKSQKQSKFQAASHITLPVNPRERAKNLLPRRRRVELDL